MFLTAERRGLESEARKGRNREISRWSLELDEYGRSPVPDPRGQRSSIDG